MPPPPPPFLRPSSLILFCVVVPGQVENLTCPSSSDGSILNIMWQQSDSESVNDYVVEVEEYFLQPGSQSLDSRPLDEPFHEVVRSDGVLATAVMSGIGK